MKKPGTIKCPKCGVMHNNQRIHDLWHHSSPRVQATMRRVARQNALKARLAVKAYANGTKQRPIRKSRRDAIDLAPVVASAKTAVQTKYGTSRGGMRTWTPEQKENRRRYQEKRRKAMLAGTWVRLSERKKNKLGTNGASPAEPILEAAPRMSATRFTAEQYLNAAEILKAIGLGIKFTEDNR